MIGLTLHLDDDGSFPDLVENRDTDQIIHLGNDAPPMHLTVLPGGMASGKPSVMLLINLPDGRVVLAETSLALLQMAVRAFTAKYGEVA